MEARIGESQRFYGPPAPDFMLKEKDWMGVGRRGMAWDLNDWKWDGDLFVARPVNSVPSDCRSKQLFPGGQGADVSEGERMRILAGKGVSNSSSSCSDEIDAVNGKGKGELEKRRRVVMVDDVEELNEEGGTLTLKLGGHVYPVTDADVVNWGERSGKKTKLHGANSSRSVCQVEDCGADLSSAKDYHRRHKVCEAHSKASQALVGNVMQRFCQQCSRFHLIQEFDEGKRSCRRRLAGHNRRRRKSQPDAAGGSSSNDERASSYLLISLLRILSNLHSNSSDQAKDQDFLSHLLRNLASHGSSTVDESNLSRLLQDSQRIGNSIGTSSEAEPASLLNAFTHVTAQESSVPLRTGIQNPLSRPINDTACVTVASLGMPQKGIIIHDSVDAEHARSTEHTNALSIKDSLPSRVESTVERVKLNNIDLNDIYDESQDFVEGPDRLHSPTDLGTNSFDCPSWIPQDSHHSSPTQPSGNSDSASAQSPSSSGDAQSRTDRIVFKLFGKDPNEFPLTLRAQILSWLSHSPTDIESYIRPGCIILTIYVRLKESTWKELCCELSSSLHRLLDVSDDVFWTTGWVYARIQHRVAFIYNGRVVLDTPMLCKSLNQCSILSVSPIAVSAYERARFTVKGFNLHRSTTRLLCAFDGEYLVQEAPHISQEGTDTLKEHDDLPCLSFSCSIPNITGRGFIEVEDHGLSSSFFPFIVAEQDVCSEIRMLEIAIEVDECNVVSQKKIDAKTARNHALDFLHEMGWLLRRSHLRCRSDHSLSDVFPFVRFKWLMEFSMDHDWCAVVKKLLDVLFEGTVDAGGSSSVELALLDMGLLHKAVRRNCRPMVEFLLRYTPDKAGQHHGEQVDGGSKGFLFRPDMLGPAGVTPLHIAASRDDTENVLDALTDDPGKVGIEAWKCARDSTGFAPQDYARLRGYYSYIHLVQKKINKRAEARHVVLDIPGGIQKPTNNLNSGKLKGFQTDKCELGAVQAFRSSCKVCTLPYPAYSKRSRSLLFRPAMLSMVAIAAVCVCVGLFFHGPPEVICVFPPFRWEMLEFGSI